MTKSALTLFAVALLSGCTDSARETDVEKESRPAIAESPSPIDAEMLLASTLEKAKAENKRVIAHLGAPW